MGDVGWTVSHSRSKNAIAAPHRETPRASHSAHLPANPWYLVQPRGPRRELLGRVLGIDGGYAPLNWEADSNAKDSGPNRGTSCSLQQRLGCGARVVREPAETRGGAALAHGRFRASVGAKPGIGARGLREPFLLRGYLARLEKGHVWRIGWNLPAKQPVNHGRKYRLLACLLTYLVTCRIVLGTAWSFCYSHLVQIRCYEKNVPNVLHSLMV